MTDWQTRVDAVWDDESLSDEARIDEIERLASERGAGDAVALFERAGAYDSAGREQEAEPLYRAALEAGLDTERRTRAVIQLASTIRNLGKLDESLSLLETEYRQARPGGMRDAAAAFYALALASSDREREGLAIVLEVLAPHLPRYQRSVRGYAAELVHAPERMPTANTGEGPEPRR
ncbi:tetratricopeptide repeat protein [Microbacterium sp. SORGH_AS_0862]|uniref:tetratricopeptide repeat protein n=1 Tax=Microbacterium sp. SORGH_AS_0862 TaxID=3041789 RepID=UPI002793E8EC|nr:tetratricopeptide repeat protein [Microbacterium sp. SORGH_AS_0862]MDQ1203736.1 tetratricopeptide (TPR) repeat protein [Microbacterium sp. SORGH_AS_0862]